MRAKWISACAVGEAVGIAFVAWIAANAIGWALAMAIIMVAATSAGRDWPLVVVALLGAGSGAIAGALVGATTSLALPASRRSPVAR